MEVCQPRTLKLGTENVCNDRMVEDLSADKINIIHSISYHNHLDYDVEVRDRIGFVQVIRSHKNSSGQYYKQMQERHLRGFYIHYRVELSGNDLLRARDFYQRLRHDSPLFEKLYQEVMYKLDERGALSSLHVLDGCIRLREMDFRRPTINGPATGFDSLYVEELGISIAIGEGGALQVVDSIEDVIKARNNATTLAFKDSLDDSALISIEAIDNSGHQEYSKLYVSVCDQVFEIPVRYDSNDARHGVIIRSHPSVAMLKNSPELKRSDILTQVFSFEEAFERLGVATSIDDARNRGDSKRGLERELAERQAEIKRMDMDLAERARLGKIEEEDRKVRLQEIEDERLRLKLQAEEQDRQRKQLESETAHLRNMEKMAAEHDILKVKQHHEKTMVEERGFWEGVSSIFKIVSNVISLGGGLNKLITS